MCKDGPVQAMSLLNDGLGAPNPLNGDSRSQVVGKDDTVLIKIFRDVARYAVHRARIEATSKTVVKPQRVGISCSAEVSCDVVFLSACRNSAGRIMNVTVSETSCDCHARAVDDCSTTRVGYGSFRQSLPERCHATLVYDNYRVVERLSIG